MMPSIYALFILCSLQTCVNALDIPILYEGWVKVDAIADSRQVIGERNDQFLLAPEPVKCDKCFCTDINARPQNTIVVFDTILEFTIPGPEVWYAKSKTVFAGDFWGARNEENIDTFRLRYAFGQFDWEKVSLLIGQFWHPVYIPDCSPLTVSYSGGVPIETYSRNPQIRVTTRHENVECIFAATSQVDFLSNGPEGLSPDYIRNALMPNFHLQTRCTIASHFFGAFVDVKRLAPRLKNNCNCEVHEHITSGGIGVFACYLTDILRVMGKAMYIQNGTDYSLLGGYAVSSLTPNDYRTYTNLSNANVWLDLTYHHGNLVPGIFMGFSKNLGSQNQIVQCLPFDEPTVYAVLPNTSSLIRVSPRFWWDVEPVRLAIELECTRANFGKLNDFAKVTKGTPVTSYRLYVSMMYFF